MKSIFIFAFFLMMSLSGFSQNRTVQQLFEKYAGEEGITSVSINKNMFDLFMQIETTPDDEYMNAIKELTGIKILSSDNTKVKVDFLTDILPQVDSKYYEELMSIDESDQKVKFLIHKKENKISELLMVMRGESENSIIWITGTIDMKTIGKIASSMNIEGMENLDKIEKK